MPGTIDRPFNRDESYFLILSELTSYWIRASVSRFQQLVKKTQCWVLPKKEICLFV